MRILVYVVFSLVYIFMVLANPKHAVMWTVLYVVIMPSAAITLKFLTHRKRQKRSDRALRSE